MGLPRIHEGRRGKKNESADASGSFPDVAQQWLWIASGGDVTKWDHILDHVPLRDLHATVHAWLCSRGISCISPRDAAGAVKDLNRRLSAFGL